MPRFEWIALPEELAKFALEGEPVPAELAPVSAVALPDPTVSYVGHTPRGVFTFAVEPHDPAAHAKLTHVHVGYSPVSEPLPDGLGEHPEHVTTLPYHFFKPYDPTDATVVVDGGAAPVGEYHVLAVCEFES